MNESDINPVEDIGNIGVVESSPTAIGVPSALSSCTWTFCAVPLDISRPSIFLKVTNETATGSWPPSHTRLIVNAVSPAVSPAFFKAAVGMLGSVTLCRTAPVWRQVCVTYFPVKFNATDGFVPSAKAGKHSTVRLAANDVRSFRGEHLSVCCVT